MSTEHIATLKQHPCPPLPPPPPPLPQIAISNLNQTINSNSNNNGYAHTLAQIPSSLIRPTTAGLLQQQQKPSTEFSYTTNGENCFSKANSLAPGATVRSLSSPEFKDELIKKQSKFSNLSVPVEERIKQKQTTDNMVFSRQQLPDKLLLTAQREKKPFAYSPDVNDPNNRGKIDLSQIKSPIMRRRLLANMESGEGDESKDNEEEELDDYQKENYNGEEESLQHINPINLIYSNGQQQQQQNGEKDNYTKFSDQQPTIEIKHYEPIKFENYSPFSINNNTIKVDRVVGLDEPSIQYYERPVFYNTRYDNSSSPINNQAQLNNSYYSNSLASSSSISPQSVSTEQQSLSSSCSLSNQRRLDELSNEVNESLNSLSELVSNLEFANKNNYNNHQRMTSFSSCQEKNFRQQQPLHSPTFTVNGNNKRSIGDYLLSQDTSYFSSNSSNTNPYPITPYYGSSLVDWNENQNHSNLMSNSRTNNFGCNKTFSMTNSNKNYQ